MPFCPECRYEYVEGTTECPDCNVQLIDKLPPSPEELAHEHNMHLDNSPLVLLVRPNDNQQAFMINDALAVSKIQTWSHSSPSGKSRVDNSIYVLEDHLEDARKVLASLNLSERGA